MAKELTPPRRAAGRVSTPRRRLAVLGERDFRLFFVGYATSLLGSSMATLAVAFAVLDSGGSQSDLGFVMAARIIPIVTLLLGGGVVADRVGSRRVMIGADAARCAAQAVFAAVLLTEHPPIWVFVMLVAVWGVGEAFFDPRSAPSSPQSRLARCSQTPTPWSA
jgi:MFS family permease